MEKKRKEDHINAVQVELENLQEKNAKYYQGIKEKCNILVKEKRDNYCKQCKLARKIQEYKKEIKWLKKNYIRYK